MTATPKPSHKAQFEASIERKLLNLKILQRKRADAWQVFFSILCQERPIEYVRKLLAEWETLDIAVKQLEQEMHLADVEMNAKWQLRANAISEPMHVTPMCAEEFAADKRYLAPRPKYILKRHRVGHGHKGAA